MNEQQSSFIRSTFGLLSKFVRCFWYAKVKKKLYFLSNGQFLSLCDWQVNAHCTRLKIRVNSKWIECVHPSYFWPLSSIFVHYFTHKPARCQSKEHFSNSRNIRKICGQYIIFFKKVILWFKVVFFHWTVLSQYYFTVSLSIDKTWK